jgi:CspA family cold shock protein
MSDVLEHIDRQDGVVKWFDPRKGFGFIVGPAGQDIFVHYSVIASEGFKVLKDGSKVNYDATRTDKGWKATRAVPLAPPPGDAPPEVTVFKPRSPSPTGQHPRPTGR